MIAMLRFLGFVALPLAAAVLYARIIHPGQWPLASLALDAAGRLDLPSVAAGCVLGYLMSTAARYPWSELPARIAAFLGRLVPSLQVLSCAAICVAVLVYW